jgi:hypothetical protein
MEPWNRNELYEEVWNNPASKVAAKYGISDVMLGKVCRKLSIPVPGRGYWARKAAGQKLKKSLLPQLKEVPLVQRFKMPGETASKPVGPPPPDPTDEMFLRIRSMESTCIEFTSVQTRHKLIVASEKRLLRAKANRDGILEAQEFPCLDIRVSHGTLQRALSLMNALIVQLESEGFPVLVGEGQYNTVATVSGHPIRFAILEKLDIAGRHEVKEGGWKRKIVDHALSGALELRMGDFTNGPRFRDRKGKKLEGMLPQCIAGIMRLGREEVLKAERARLWEEERQRKSEELWKLSQEIGKEDAKVKELEEWAASSAKAKQIRDFVHALEALWASQGADTSQGSSKGLRLEWMRLQANRIDPLVESPPSVLDRRRELQNW